MPENNMTPSKSELPVEPQAVTETAQERFERERLARRNALKRFGMTSAMATFALFSVDDLAHMVGKAMQQRAGDNRVAAKIANEFNNAGIVIAGGVPTHAACTTPNACNGLDMCTCCSQTQMCSTDICTGTFQINIRNGMNYQVAIGIMTACIATADAAYPVCRLANHCPS